MKATGIRWEIDGLPTEMEIPDEILENVDKTQGTAEIYAQRVEIISDYLSEATGFCHEGFVIETERKDAIQYALDQGTGIEYEAALGETTEKELAEASDRAVRYVEPQTVDFFSQQKEEIQFCLIAHMDLIDFDEWMAVRDAFEIDIPYKDATKIINMLYENYNYSTLEMGDSPRGSIKDTIGIDISPEEEKMIYDIVSSYGCKVELSETEKQDKNASLTSYYTNDRSKADEALLGYTNCDNSVLDKLNKYAGEYEEAHGGGDISSVDDHLLSNGVFMAGNIVSEPELDKLINALETWKSAASHKHDAIERD